MKNKRRFTAGNIILLVFALLVVGGLGYWFYTSVYLNDHNSDDSTTEDDAYVKPGEIDMVLDISSIEEDFMKSLSGTRFSMGDIEKMALDTNLDLKIGELLEESNKLYSKNNDFKALLIAPGCGILDEPVMKTYDKYDYYLYRDFEKKHNITGTLFFGDGVDESSDISIIHGHNMKNGQMFGSLEKYKDKNVYSKYPRIAIVTLKEVILYDIVAAIYTYIPEKGSDDFMYFDYLGTPCKNSKVEFIKWVNSNKLYDCRKKLSVNDKIMILSTCSYQTTDGRFILIAKRIN